MTARPATLFALVASLVVAGVAGAGLYLNGSPADVRGHRLDARRANDLREIATTVDEYWRGHESTLPNDLSGVWQGRRLKDPETGKDYEYRRVDAGSYELSAVFHAASEDEKTEQSRLAVFSLHQAGRQCFVLDTKTLRK